MEATLVIMSASLSLQPGFAHIDNNEGRPSPAWLLPLTLSATVEGALLFVICSDLEGKHYIPGDEARLYIYIYIYITLLNFKASTCFLLFMGILKDVGACIVTSLFME